ncbi:hypothetical protein J6590_027047 [Homalodisca vitripennis]|nr:hypothetical protein J6590_027047 [Homalodisca vitripennis]
MFPERSLLLTLPPASSIKMSFMRYETREDDYRAQSHWLSTSKRLLINRCYCRAKQGLEAVSQRDGVGSNTVQGLEKETESDICSGLFVPFISFCLCLVNIAYHLKHQTLSSAPIPTIPCLLLKGLANHHYDYSMDKFKRWME